MKKEWIVQMGCFGDISVKILGMLGVENKVDGESSILPIII